MPRQFVRCPPEPSFVAGFERIRDELDIPPAFPAPVLDAADDAVRRGPLIPPGADPSTRDCRDLELIAIDPAGSTDLDQAFGAEPIAAGYRVHYAIADVAAFVEPGGAIDDEARTRGLTLYSPDRRTSLHPEVISEGAASLLAGAERRALLWTIDVDGDGTLLDATVERATVRTSRQMSYREAQAESARAAADSVLGLLRRIGELRQEQEADRGAVSLALPTQEVVGTGDGAFAVVYDDTLPIEGWNAQISLLTGIAASKIMLDVGVGLLRTLPPPEDRTVTRLRRTARALGLSWPDDVGYAERIRELRPDSPEEAALLSQAARGLRGAGYVAFADADHPDQPRHAAIASTYAHVTAPLRRLCDRFGNEVVLAHCAGRTPPVWAVEALDELPGQMGRARQRDRSLERAVVDYVEAVTLMPLVGQRFRAVVTDVNDDRNRARVQLRSPAVVAHVTTDGLTLGDDVALRLDDADPQERSVTFSVIDVA